MLNIAFGLMGLCGVAFSSVIFFIPADAAGPNPILQLMEEYPLYRTFMMVSVGLGLIATLVLIVAGIGLMQFKNYGRLLSLDNAFYAIVSGLVGTVVNFVFVVMPLMEKLGDGPEAAGAMGGMIGRTIGGLVGLIYPGLLIYFIHDPAARRTGFELTGEEPDSLLMSASESKSVSWLEWAVLIAIGMFAIACFVAIWLWLGDFPIGPPG
ncbi:MAG: hypothetical protein SFU86_24755 [Pirellulaceae bacterium]|nr:hypothetical protein [Pirellulaceae bacterium]